RAEPTWQVPKVVPKRITSCHLLFASTTFTFRFGCAAFGLEAGSCWRNPCSIDEPTLSGLKRTFFSPAAGDTLRGIFFLRRCAIGCCFAMFSGRKRSGSKTVGWGHRFGFICNDRWPMMQVSPCRIRYGPRWPSVCAGEDEGEAFVRRKE